MKRNKILTISAVIMSGALVVSAASLLKAHIVNTTGQDDNYFLEIYDSKPLIIDRDVSFFDGYALTDLGNRIDFATGGGAILDDPSTEVDCVYFASQNSYFYNVTPITGISFIDFSYGSFTSMDSSLEFVIDYGFTASYGSQQVVSHNPSGVTHKMISFTDEVLPNYFKITVPNPPTITYGSMTQYCVYFTSLTISYACK